MKKNKTLILLVIIFLAVLAAVLTYIFSPESDELVSIPPTTDSGEIIECYTDADCLISGCSGTLCVPRNDSENLVTTCEYRNEYSCFADDNCLCQQNKCNWQGSDLFTACVKDVSGDGCEGLVGDQLAGCQIEQSTSTVCQGLSGIAYIDCYRQAGAAS